MSQVETDAGSVAADELKQFIERIERLEEEKASIQGDIKEVEMRRGGHIRLLSGAGWYGLAAGVGSKRGLLRFRWRSLRESNPCFSLERAAS